MQKDILYIVISYTSNMKIGGKERVKDGYSKKYCVKCRDWNVFILGVGEPDEIVEECSNCGNIRKLKIIGRKMTVPMNIYKMYLEWKKGERTPDSKAMEEEFKRIDNELNKASKN